MKQLFRKNYEKSVPLIILNSYKQIGSSFKLGNIDRFGDPYAALKPLRENPGPGSYQLSDAFTKTRSHSMLDY